MFNYLYIVNYPKEEKELFLKEMDIFFQGQFDYPYFFSDVDIDENRSLYLKYKLKIQYHNHSLNDLVKEMWDNQYSKEKYRVYYLQVQQIKTHYQDRLNAMKEVANHIVGDYNFEYPIDKVGVIKINNIYYVGTLFTSDPKWDKYKHKPYSYSQSLPIRLAKSLVNLAVGIELNKTILDGCCGVGTVILEGLFMNAKITGVDINPLIASQAKENLRYYGYHDTYIMNADFLDVKGYYDCIILDIPYGILSIINEEEIVTMIQKANQISNRLLLVSTSNLETKLLESGYKDVDVITIHKQNFKRYLHISNKEVRK